MHSRSKIRFAAVAALAPLTIGLAACSSDSSTESSGSGTTAEAPTTTARATGTTMGSMEEEATMDIVETALAAGEFDTLAALLTEAGLVEALQGEGPFTVFAPTDAAFAALDPATLEAVQNDPELLTQVLTYHVLEGKVLAEDVTAGDVTMLSGDTATIAISGGTVTIDGATIVTTDIITSNGVIHVIDAVMVPGD